MRSQRGRLPGILEKKRGVGPKACTHGCVHHVTGRAAYSNEHINPLLRGVSSDVAMQRLGPAAKFEHLPQNRDAPPRRRVSQARRAWRAPRPDWSCSNRYKPKCPDDGSARRASFRAPVSEPSPRSRAGSIPYTPATAIPARMFETLWRPVSAALECCVDPTRNSTPSSEYSTSSARTSAFRRLPVQHGAARDDTAKLGDARIVGVQHGHAVRRQSLDQLALGRGDAVDRIEELDMRVADVGHHADLRARRSRPARESRPRDSCRFRSPRPARLRAIAAATAARRRDCSGCPRSSPC